MFIILLIIFILIILNKFSLNDQKNNCKCISENMTNNYNKFLNTQSSYLIRNNTYSIDETIEITNLPICKKEITVDYGLNINTYINNLVSINQIINDPLIHTIEVDKKNYNLIQIDIRKTNFTYNNKIIGLTLHLIHSDYVSLYNFNIIIPLDFVSDISSIETFKNINYKKMNTFFKKHIPSTINTIKNSGTVASTSTNNKSNNAYNLLIKYKRPYNIKKINTNFLFSSKTEIPTTNGYVNTTGPIVNLNLCSLKPIIENNSQYYIIKEENGNTNLITEPNIINNEYGNLIRNYINKDKNLLYIK